MYDIFFTPFYFILIIFPIIFPYFPLFFRHKNFSLLFFGRFFLFSLAGNFMLYWHVLGAFCRCLWCPFHVGVDVRRGLRLGELGVRLEWVIMFLT